MLVRDPMLSKQNDWQHQFFSAQQLKTRKLVILIFSLFPPTCWTASGFYLNFCEAGSCFDIRRERRRRGRSRRKKLLRRSGLKGLAVVVVHVDVERQQQLVELGCRDCLK